MMSGSMPNIGLVDALLRVRAAEVSTLAAVWPFLDPARSRTLTCAEANSYLLYCQLEFQVPTGVAEQGARRVLDAVANPDRLWHTIASHPLSEWERRAGELKIHRFPVRTGRAVWRVAHRMTSHFDGDARLIWAKGDSAAAFINLIKILQVGPQLSRMCVLGLLEAGLVRGDGDVKADVHVMRVLGRATRGAAFQDGETDQVQRTLAVLMPEGKWRLDLPLWTVGRKYCAPSEPACPECPLVGMCAHASRRADTPRS